MKIVPTRRTDYAIRALLYLTHAKDWTAKGPEIAEQMDIPEGFLRQILQELQSKSIVVSRPSRRGGYSLARAPQEITLLSIVEALEGPQRETECALRGGPCHWEEVCALHWVWSGARDAFAAELGTATLAGIAADDAALIAGEKAIPESSHRRQT